MTRTGDEKTAEERAELAQKLLGRRRRKVDSDSLGKLRSCAIRLPEEILNDIDAFCLRFGLSRVSWFAWAISTQYLAYKKMMKDAGEQKDAEKPDEP